MKNTNHIISLISNIRDDLNKLIVSQLERNSISGLAPSHGSILQLLFNAKDTLTMQNISEKINRDKSTITALVNKLLRLGYIEKIKSIEDSRVTMIVLSKKGWELEPIFNRISKNLLDTIYKDFTYEQQLEVIDALEKINKNI
jgi:DNA-binding MarR family transcriptional regulator